MFLRHFLRMAFVIVVLVALLFVPAVPNQATSTARGQMALALQAPPFVNVARAAEASPTAFDLGAYLDQEAGISAYYHSPDAITLSQVRGQFRTIEMETADFIIGSVSVTNYAEHFDAHVYVSTNGWILAYYLRGDPTSKIADVKARTISNTKLKTVVAQIASAAGAPFTDVTYYDFRYPNATGILLVAEDEDNGNDFTIQLPSSFGYYERGWAEWDNYSQNYFRVDGVNVLGSATYCGDSACYGTLTASQLLPDVTHTITVYSYWSSAYGVLIITYRVL